MNFGFYISGKSARFLKFLKESSESEKKSIKIVFSNRELDSELKETLNELNIAFYEKAFSKFAGNNLEERRISFSNELLRVLTENKADYCFSFGRYIIAGDVLKEYRNRIINFHPSILPMYPGGDPTGMPMDRAIRDKRKVFLIGNTAHFIDEGTDTGPIIMQYVVPLQTFFNAQKNYDIVLDMQIVLLHKVIKLLEENRISVDAENIVHIDNADYDRGFIFPYLSS